jgi:hypothetical protein
MKTIEITVRARCWGVVGVRRVLVERGEDGTPVVWVWDSVGGAYTRRHDLSARSIARIVRIAGDQRMIPELLAARLVKGWFVCYRSRRRN